MRRLLLLLALCSLVACATAPPPPEPVAVQAPAEPEGEPRPSGDILFQPRFEWDDGQRSANGTGFLTRTADGQVVGVGSAHYILGELVPVAATFVSIRTGRPLFRSEIALGPVGDGTGQAQSSVAHDYFFVVPPREIDASHALELDARPKPELGEAVWFPNKNFDNGEGFELIDAEVTESGPDAIVVRWARRTEVQSQSGSPFVSKVTGQVIGTFSRFYEDEAGRMHSILTPARRLREALSATRAAMPLAAAAKAELSAAPTEEIERFEFEPQPVALASSGSAPKVSLQYAPTVGARYTMSLSREVSTKVHAMGRAIPAGEPSAMTDVVAVLVREVGPSAILLDVEVVERRHRGPAASPVPKESLRTRVALSPHGAVLWYDAAAGLSDAALAGLGLTLERLSELCPPVPTEPVGPGARWTVRASSTLEDRTIETRTTYALQRSSGALRLTWTSEWASPADEVRTVQTPAGPAEVLGVKIARQGEMTRAVDATFGVDRSERIRTTTRVRQQVRGRTIDSRVEITEALSSTSAPAAPR